MRLASLASVLVGAIPIEMGMPVHCLTPLSNGSAQRLNVQVLQWSKVEKHFIDGINFNVWDKFQNGTHHPSRHVVVQRVIGGPNHHLMTIKPIAALEGGFAHADASIFGFL